MFGTQASDGVPGFYNKLQNHDNIPTTGKYRKTVSHCDKVLSMEEVTLRNFKVSGSSPNISVSGRAVLRERSETDEPM